MATLQAHAAVGPGMRWQDRGAALLVILIWGSNFVVVKWGLDRMPPTSLGVWRFVLSFFPACLLLRLRQPRWGLMAVFGVITGVGQFGCLYFAMRGFISPGLASIVVQTQAFFNVGLAVLVLKERVRFAQILGCLLAGAGLTLIAVGAGSSATPIGIGLCLLSALSWASCNVLLRAKQFSGDLLPFLVWSSLFSAVPLMIIALLFEGREAVLFPLAHGDAVLWAIIGWQGFANTLFGYVIWNGLIRTYSLSRIGPLTLLVPVVALSLSVLLLGERLTSLEAAAATLIVAGVALPLLRRPKPALSGS